MNIWHRRLSAALALIMVLAGAALVRYRDIRMSYSFDEILTVYLATGRDMQIYRVPVDTILNPPPKLFLDGAPGLRHVWTGLKSCTHPPLYFMLLRLWMDWFHSHSELTTRAFSSVFSLLSICLIFDCVRRTSGYSAAIVAAILMAFANTQVSMSQYARNYTISALLILVLCQAILRIDKSGPSLARLFQAGLAVALLLSTHYFNLLPLAGIGIYVLWGLRGGARSKTIVATSIGALIAISAWVPWYIQQYQAVGAETADKYDTAKNFTFLHHLARIDAAVETHLFGGGAIVNRNQGGTVLKNPGSDAVVLTALLFLVPPFFARQRLHLMLWWCMMASVFIGFLAFDILTAHDILNYYKHTFVATVGMIALLAEPFSFAARGTVSRRPWLPLGAKAVVCIVLLGIANSCVQRLITVHRASTEDATYMPIFYTLDRTVGKNTLVVIGSCGMVNSAFPLLVYEAYNHISRPIMIIDDANYQPLTAKARSAISQWQAQRKPLLLVTQMH